MARDDRSIPWQLAGLGLELGLLIGGLTFLGHLADQRFGTEPWLTLAGVLLAMTGGCYTLARQVFKMNAKDKRRSP